MYINIGYDKNNEKFNGIMAYVQIKLFISISFG